MNVGLMFASTTYTTLRHAIAKLRQRLEHLQSIAGRTPTDLIT